MPNESIKFKPNIMATAKSRLEDFKERLTKAGLRDQVNFEIVEDHRNDEEKFIRVRMEVTTKPYSHANCLALMGLISHFCNRLWAESWTYMYIMQSHHGLTFIDGDDEIPYLIIDPEDGEIYKRSDLVNCRKWIINKLDEGRPLEGYQLILESKYKEKYPTSE